MHPTKLNLPKTQVIKLTDMEQKKNSVKPAQGKLGILVVGNGAVATTFMTGVLMTRKGLTKPVGSMTQYDKIRVGTEPCHCRLPLAERR